MDALAWFFTWAWILALATFRVPFLKIPLIWQGVKQFVLLLDRWLPNKKASSLAQFAKHLQPNGRLMTASPRGYPEVVPDRAVQAFMLQHKAETKQDLRFGANWDATKKFAKALIHAGSKLSHNTIVFNHLRQSVASVDFIYDLKLPDRYYVVGGFRSDLIGHCFALQASDSELVVHEQGDIIELRAYGGVGLPACVLFYEVQNVFCMSERLTDHADGLLSRADLCVASSHQPPGSVSNLKR